MSVHRLRGRKGLQHLGSLTIAAFVGTATAEAADYLRGAYAPDAVTKSEGIDWAGVYVGGYVGYTGAQVDPSRLRSRLAQEGLPNSTFTSLLQSTINLRKIDKDRTSFGGFAGVNYLWDDVVLGIEVDYTRSALDGSTTAGPYGLSQTAGTEENGVSSTTTARARVHEWGTIRGRVGYAAGWFMPYITAGLALGNIDGRATVSGTWERIDVSSPPARPVIASGSFNATIGRRGIAYGGAVGAGVDMALFSNVFLRAEWQYIQFGSSGLRPEVSLHTARVGGGVKF